MEGNNKEWDEVLKKKLGSDSHPTEVRWEQVEERLPKKKAGIRKIGWLLKVAAVFIAIAASYSIYSWYSTPSWEYSPVASVQSLEDTESSFFSADELHSLYISKE
jgi:hypothetical protein